MAEEITLPIHYEEDGIPMVKMTQAGFDAYVKAIKESRKSIEPISAQFVLELATNPAVIQELASLGKRFDWEEIMNCVTDKHFIRSNQ